jgi:hypothetical protein
LIRGLFSIHSNNGNIEVHRYLCGVEERTDRRVVGYTGKQKGCTPGHRQFHLHVKIIFTSPGIVSTYVLDNKPNAIFTTVICANTFSRNCQHQVKYLGSESNVSEKQVSDTSL